MATAKSTCLCSNNLGTVRAAPDPSPLVRTELPIPEQIDHQRNELMQIQAIVVRNNLV